MSIAILQVIFKFVLTLSVIFGFAFMVIYTALVIVSAVRGGIKINVIRDETENEKK